MSEEKALLPMCSNNQPPPPQPYPGYPPPAASGITAYDPMKQTAPPGLGPPHAGYVAPPYYPASQPPPPPGAWAPQPIAQQQTSNNVVVMNSQPSVVSSTVRVTSNDQSSFIFGVVVSVVAVFCLCWCSLVCTIPGAVVGHMAATAGRNGDKVAKRKYDQISGALIIAGIVFQVIGPIIIIASVVGPRLKFTAHGLRII
ncbi:uncharacterized protein LOC135339462 [Halichondria panicea]|uniref:uncharacterized protein LOC135339462 n=1 Tax=Halichondria panicea TaxID=6063 RepID=UPI00312B9D9A